MLAVVVDDHDMGVSHVLRGDDHFRNTFRQLPIFQAMGWDIPEFAHVPLIHGPDGAKLSKRHGAVGVEAYRDMGYLPEGLRNYLLRLGWSHGDREIFSDEEAIGLFTLDGLNAAPARLDFDKMGAINAACLRSADPDRIAGLVIAEMEGRLTLDEADRTRIRSAMAHLLDRGQTIVELAEACDFLVQKRPLELSKGARKALKGEDASGRLRAVHDALAAAPDWTADALKARLEGLAGELALGFGAIGAPVRAALTGGKASPDIGLVMEWFGREEVLGRLMDQIEAATA